MRSGRKKERKRKCRWRWALVGMGMVFQATAVVEGAVVLIDTGREEFGLYILGQGLIRWCGGVGDIERGRRK